MYICVYIYIYCVYVYLSLSLFLSLSIYIYICIYIYIYIYTHTHTCHMLAQNTFCPRRRRSRNFEVEIKSRGEKNRETKENNIETTEK